jgi:chemotaxis response regulator CheB
VISWAGLRLAESMEEELFLVAIKQEPDKVKPQVRMQQFSNGSEEWRWRDCEPPTLVVGVGASAGGLAAYKSFLASTPADTRMAFVLVQHLDPHHKSLLVELLGANSPIPVVAAKDAVEARRTASTSSRPMRR